MTHPFKQNHAHTHIHTYTLDKICSAGKIGTNTKDLLNY